MANKKKALSLVEKIIAFQHNKTDESAITFEISKDKTEVVSVKVKRFISLEEMVDFVDNVVNGLFDDSGNYNPTIYNFLFASAVLAYYTDIKFDDPENKIISDIVCKTNILHSLLEFISERQIETILDSIEKKIEFKQQEIFSTQTTLLNRNLQQLEIYTDILKQFSEQAKDLDITSISEAVTNLANKDESEIVNAVLNFNDMKDK